MSVGAVLVSYTGHPYCLQACRIAVVSPSQCTVTQRQGGIEVGRGAVRNDQSQGAELVVTVP